MTNAEKALAGAAVAGGLYFLLRKRPTQAAAAAEGEGGSNPATPTPPTPPKPRTETKPTPRPAPRPRPIPKPKQGRKLGPRINDSTVDAAGSVRQSIETLLAQARKFDPLVSVDELAAARLIASEYASGSETEWAAIVDAEMNRAEKNGRSLMRSLTGTSARFGRQGASPPRPASTRLDPRRAHLDVAIAVVRGGEMRGISRGATRFFDPRAQDGQHNKWKSGGSKHIHSCPALGTLEAWSFDYRRGKDRDGKRRRRCPPDKTRVGKNTLAWVGPIAGIDAYELMLFAPTPTGLEHTKRYVAARALIEARKRARRA